MPELWSQALAQPGLIWLLGAALVAGLVRGFSGFGTAMVYLPVAGTFLDPFAALTTLLVMDLIGPLPNVPRALRDRHPGDMSRLTLGLIIALPIGVLVLTQVPVEAFRYGVSLIALALLVLLISGYRYRGALTPRLITGTGMLGRFPGRLYWPSRSAGHHALHGQHPPGPCGARHFDALPRGGGSADAGHLLAL